MVLDRAALGTWNYPLLAWNLFIISAEVGAVSSGFWCGLLCLGVGFPRHRLVQLLRFSVIFSTTKEVSTVLRCLLIFLDMLEAAVVLLLFGICLRLLFHFICDMRGCFHL